MAAHGVHAITSVTIWNLSGNWWRRVFHKMTLSFRHAEERTQASQALGREFMGGSSRLLQEQGGPSRWKWCLAFQ